MSRWLHVRRVLAAVLVVAVVLSAGCRRGHRRPADSGEGRAAGATLVEIPQVKADTGERLRLTLETPPDVRRGTPVVFLFRAVNIAAAPVDLYLRGRDVTLDIEIVNGEGELVWRRLEDAVIPAVVMLRTLSPGDTLEVPVAWDQRTSSGATIPAGTYRVRALLLTEEPPPLATPTVSLRITP